MMQLAEFPIVPGLGWGPARLGATLGALVAAFGRPTRIQFDGHEWAPLGLFVIIGWEDEAVDAVFAICDPDHATLERARGRTDRDITFDASEVEVIAAHGEPLGEARGADATGRAWSRLEYDGASFRFVADRLVAISVTRCADTITHATNPVLEAAIELDLDDAVPYLVYADWLQQQGNPRGELIVVQHGLLLAPDDRGLQRADDELRARHAVALLGALADSWILRTATWHLGYLTSAALVRPSFDLPAAVELLLGSRSARFLQHLTIGICPKFDPIIAALTRRPLQLRSLSLGVSPDGERPSEDALVVDDLELTLDLSALYPAVPHLRRLAVRSGLLILGTVDLPELRELVIFAGPRRIVHTDVAALATAHFPKLETLALSYIESVTALDVLDCLPPALRRLQLDTEATESARLVMLLARSTLLAQLTELAFVIDPGGVRALADHYAAFAHLARLEVTPHRLAVDDEQRLASIGSNIGLVGK